MLYYCYLNLFTTIEYDSNKKNNEIMNTNLKNYIFRKYFNTLTKYDFVFFFFYLLLCHSQLIS